jgi:hypothetical protein
MLSEKLISKCPPFHPVTFNYIPRSRPIALTVITDVILWTAGRTAEQGAEIIPNFSELCIDSGKFSGCQTV